MAGEGREVAALHALPRDIRMLDYEDIGTFTAMALRASESTLTDISVDLAVQRSRTW